MKIKLLLLLTLFPFFGLSAQDIKLNFTDSLAGRPGDTFLFEVRSNDLRGIGLKNITMRIQYDERLLKIKTDGITKGSSLSSNSYFSSDLIYGNILVEMVGNELFNSGGTLFTVEGQFTELSLDSLMGDSVSYSTPTYIILSDSSYITLNDTSTYLPSDSSIAGFYNPYGMIVSDVYFGPGKFSYSPTLPLHIPTLISKFYQTPTYGELELSIPKEDILKQNFPNPFNPMTQIQFALTNPSFTRLEVYDMSGKKVSTLLDKYIGSGSYIVDFYASDLPSGMYFYRLKTSYFSKTKVMTLLK
jgi:hypothetical protein